MKCISLNGEWLYRIGKGSYSPITVPFSRLPVGHSECLRSFDIFEQAERTFLKFNGITYYAKVFFNEIELGEMLPYCEYEFEITDIIKHKNNEIKVVLEDISPAFGPTAGWENFGGIIRDVSLIFKEKNYIEDVFFHADIINGYKDAKFVVETKSNLSSGTLDIKLFSRDELKLNYIQSANADFKEVTLENIDLWSPDLPNLYRLEVSLIDNGKTIDKYCSNIGFREFKCDKHRFLLNGEPLFLKGVCKHEMFGDSGHCPTEEQILSDMQMIKATGCNFVRLVHYPHNKKILDIADKLGLMVSE